MFLTSAIEMSLATTMVYVLDDGLIDDGDNNVLDDDEYASDNARLKKRFWMPL